MKPTEFVNNMPAIYRNNYKKAMGIGQKASKAAAIKAKCLDCTNWQKEEIRNCTVESCPLYLHRPFK